MLTAIVLLPTPPLQLDTAMIFFMPTRFPLRLNLSSFALGANEISIYLNPLAYN